MGKMETPGISSSYQDNKPETKVHPWGELQQLIKDLRDMGVVMPIVTP